MRYRMVLTVPMRNGNRKQYNLFFHKFKFLPYLWGMETKKTWKLCKHSLVLTVPMRNGNLQNIFICMILCRVLTVPMRNGNMNINIKLFLVCLFLPYLWGMETSPPFFALPGLFRSYRTYEEWKLENDFILTPFKFRSYRTYEEWKRLCLIKCSKSEYWFLPYLWGMETNVYLFRSKRFLTVLTVPMRNGNLLFGLRSSWTGSVLTVPMRNGNTIRNIIMGQGL